MRIQNVDGQDVHVRVLTRPEGKGIRVFYQPTAPAVNITDKVLEELGYVEKGSVGSFAPLEPFEPAPLPGPVFGMDDFIAKRAELAGKKVFGIMPALQWNAAVVSRGHMQCMAGQGRFGVCMFAEQILTEYFQRKYDHVGRDCGLCSRLASTAVEEQGSRGL